MDYFTSDLHLSHNATLSFRKEFNSIEEMDNDIVSAFDVVRRGDRVFILGDISWNEESIMKVFNPLFKKKVPIYWIKGNHDDRFFKKIEHPLLKKHENLTVKGHGDYAPLFLSHYPSIIFDKSHHGAYQLHGHGHRDTIDRPLLDNFCFGKRLNVNVEFHDYKLWTRDEVEEYMKSMPPNLDYILLHGTEEQQEKVKIWLNGVKDSVLELYKDLDND